MTNLNEQTEVEVDVTVSKSAQQPVVKLPIPCPFCNSKDIDLSFARGFKGGDESRPLIAAGCFKCGAAGPMVEFESLTGYEESQTAWDFRAD